MLPDFHRFIPVILSFIIHLCGCHCVCGAAGGTPPYSYLWNTGDSTETLQDIAAGAYSVTVTDSLSCTGDTSIALAANTEIFTAVTSTMNPCAGYSEGTATVSVTGGTAPYSVEWTTGNMTTYIQGLADGTYYVTLTDAYGCEKVDSAVITYDPANDVAGTEVRFAGACFAYGQPVEPYCQPVPAAGAVFSWDMGDGTVYSTAQAPPHYYAADMYHCIQFSVTNQCGSRSLDTVIYLAPDDCYCTSGIVYDYTEGDTLPATLPVTANIDGTVHVIPGSSVEIPANAVIRFSPHGRIIVHENGYLHIGASALLTCLAECNGMWRGIEVWGSGTAYSNDPVQGTVEIGPGAVIEHAHYGVLLGRLNFNKVCEIPGTFVLFGPFNLANSGGVFRSSGTYYNPVVFRNNGTDIRILPKITKKESQACRIKHCKFSTEWALYDSRYSTYTAGNYSQGVNPFIQHANPYCRTNFGVLLDNVTRTDIDSCTFRNLQTGVESHNSRHNIEGCDFRRLFTGVRIENATPNVNNYHHILTNTFDSIPFTGPKGTAVFIKNGRYDMVVGNYFGFFTNDQGQNYNGNAVSLISTGGYKVCDNDFYYFRAGLSANNSGKAGGFVGPLNRKDGNIFLGCKRDVASAGYNKRLELRCNICENNTPTPYTDHWNNTGSLADQGKWPPVPPSDPNYDRYAAGNEFWPQLRQEVKTIPSYPFNYYHHSDWFTTPNPAGTPVDTISIHAQKTLTSCEPVLAIGNGTGIGVAVLRNQMTVLDEEKDSLETFYENTKQNLDQGNTDLLANAILSGMPNGQLKNLLIQNSPLSDDIIILLLTEDPLSPGNLKNVLELNLPVSKVVEPVFREALAALPPGIANQLASLQKRNPGVITLQTIARQIEYVETQRQYVLQLLIVALVENGLEDEAIDLLEEEATDDAIQALTATYISNNDP
ncbi:MAG: SprB repeat-containing protein, partial [Bacteroidetes bacterium]|nr:SprB repeat-containing protein [Bacteroidota bacterium]